MTFASQTHSFGLEGSDEAQKRDTENQKKDRWKRDSNQSPYGKDVDLCPVTTTSEDENSPESTDRKSHEPSAPTERKFQDVIEPKNRKLHVELESANPKSYETLESTDPKLHEALEFAEPKCHEALEFVDPKFHEALESMEPEFHEVLGAASSERFIAEHSYGGAETFDKNLTWAFTQPCSSHVRQIREIRRCLHDKRASSGWNYVNPMMRYVELCSDDQTRCSTDIEEVLEKYFKVSSLAPTSTIQGNLAARCKINEPMEIEEVIIESIDDENGAADEDLVANVEIYEELPDTGDGTQRPENKISLLGVHFLQDKKLLLLKTSHSIRKTARERYQHLTKSFGLPGKTPGSNLGLGGSCRRISRFLNDECWTEATGRRETCIVTQNISHTGHSVDVTDNPSEPGESNQGNKSSGSSIGSSNAGEKKSE